jgi:fumarate reductase subunit C
MYMHEEFMLRESNCNFLEFNFLYLLFQIYSLLPPSHEMCNYSSFSHSLLVMVVLRVKRLLPYIPWIIGHMG